MDSVAARRSAVRPRGRAIVADRAARRRSPVKLAGTRLRSLRLLPIALAVALPAARAQEHTPAADPLGMPQQPAATRQPAPPDRAPSANTPKPQKKQNTP